MPLVRPPLPDIARTLRGLLAGLLAGSAVRPGCYLAEDYVARGPAALSSERDFEWQASDVDGVSQWRCHALSAWMSAVSRVGISAKYKACSDWAGLKRIIYDVLAIVL